MQAGPKHKSALVRALEAWRGVAVVTRHELRERGVRGELRALDDWASGARGTSGPAQLARLVVTMRDHGVPEPVAQQRLVGVARDIVGLVYREAL